MSNAINGDQSIYFERGFKSWCENTSEAIRGRLGLQKFEPIEPKQLAEYLGVKILYPAEVEGLSTSTVNYLSSVDGDEWSAVAVTFLGISVIVINQSHSPSRQSVDIMHELAHIIRAHQPAQHFTNDSGFVIRSFDKTQEAEADWLAASLLLPRTALYQIAKLGNSADETCINYHVSKQLLKYRLNVTGLTKQFPRSLS